MKPVRDMAPDLLLSERFQFHNARMAIMVKAVRWLMWSAAPVVCAVSVAGCGSSNPAAPTSATAPTSTSTTAATYSLSGLLTDGFSGGILPGIDVQIMSGPNQGQDIKTDSTGHYSFAGISNGTFTVQFSAVSYVTQTATITVSADTTLNIVLQRM